MGALVIPPIIGADVPARWRRFGLGMFLAMAIVLVTAHPAAAKDTYPFFGPLEITILGANGDLREFVALSAEDRSAATDLVREVVGAIQAPAQSNAGAAGTLPHYRIGISHFAGASNTMPWARVPATEFIYYPGGQGSAGFLMVEFSPSDAALQERWVEPSPVVAAMLNRHMQGLLPMASEPMGAGTSTAPWGIGLAGLLLIGLTLVLFEDRRRWRRTGGEGAPERGRNRRS